MRRIRLISLVMVLLMCLTTPTTIMSQNHRGYRPGNETSNTDRGRSNNKRPNERPAERPNDKGNKGKHGTTPGYRPSQKPHHPAPPSSSHGGYRPYHSGHHCPPPPRPTRPSYCPVVRPHIPHGHVCYSGAPVVNNILGLTFGMAYNASLDYLYRRGYAIDGYDRGMAYLRGVNQLGYYWDDVFLGYDGYSRLSNIQFSVSTGARDTRRFNDVYHMMCHTYGAPLYHNNSYNNSECTWIGAGGRGYVTLQYRYTCVNGYYRYYTTLTYNP